jgi:O-antigen/teichoic acid export membrane protein
MGGEIEEAGFAGALKRKTHRSIGWTIFRGGSDAAFSFVVFLLMARLLTKADLGTYAIAFVFVEIGGVIASAGVIQLVARAKSLSSSRLDTMFWGSLMLGGLYCAALFAAAPLLAAAFHAPQLDDVLRWLTVPIMLGALGNTHVALRLREFGHSTVAVRSLVAGLIGGAVAVAAALSGAGVWSLVLQRLARDAIGTTLAWLAFPWRPRLDVDLRQARSDLAFGAEFAGAQLVSSLTQRAQDLIIGRFMGAVPLSTYKVAWRGTELLGPAAVSPFSTVALQTFARLQDHPESISSAYSDLMRKCSLLSVPALVGYGITGPWLLPSLFGAKWADAGWIAPALMLLAVPIIVSGFVTALLSSVGKASWQRQLAIMELGSTIVVTAVTVNYGLLWVAVGFGVRANLLMPVYVIAARKVTGIGFREHFRSLWPAVAASLVMGVAVVPLLLWLNTRNILILAPIAALGVIAYLSLLLVLLPVERQALRQRLAALVRRKD